VIVGNTIFGKAVQVERSRTLHQSQPERSVHAAVEALHQNPSGTQPSGCSQGVTPTPRCILFALQAKARVPIVCGWVSRQERSLQAAAKALHQRHDAYSSLCRL